MGIQVSDFCHLPTVTASLPTVSLFNSFHGTCHVEELPDLETTGVGCAQVLE